MLYIYLKQNSFIRTTFHPSMISSVLVQIHKTGPIRARTTKTYSQHRVLAGHLITGRAILPLALTIVISNRIVSRLTTSQGSHGIASLVGILASGSAAGRADAFQVVAIGAGDGLARVAVDFVTIVL